MNIDLLIKMTNEIGEFFAGTTDTEAAAAAVANHLKRYWDPRMRTQMLSYYEQRQGAGLSDLGKKAVALLHDAAKSAPVASHSPDAAPPPKGAGA